MDSGPEAEHRLESGPEAVGVLVAVGDLKLRNFSVWPSRSPLAAEG